MDLIDRAELKKLPSVQLFGTVRTVDIDNAQKVDAIPIGKVMNMIDEIQAEIEKYNSDCRWALSKNDEKCIRCTEITFSCIQSIINEIVKEYKT